ncbi:MAG: prepilin-type N-terminal cleavage/methylation domain-containing protein [Candidatus Omnitrophica bacterium]|nr:prepilin-type N-terminal cleavage/methylation domain-containing protein [Candidatus Omnitrophota bacterium]MBU4149150.1 prepilin-type N-terminal cleavage/methylation domain-containing protein [Candidatus Omnitrophota bacterium]
MFHGLRRGSRNKAGLTLVEVMVSTLLITVVFLGVSALYVASQQIFFKADNKIIISYELQYAVEHIYKNVMRAVGDETAVLAGSRPLEVPDADPATLYITANTNDPITSANYSDTVTYTYSKSGEDLMFDNGSGPESIIPKISVTDVSFALSGNILTIELTGSYRDQSLTFYSACYPQLASFH